MPPPIHWFELATGFEISDWLSIGSSLFQIGFQQDELLNHSYLRPGQKTVKGKSGMLGDKHSYIVKRYITQW